MNKCTPDHQPEQIHEMHRIIPAIKGRGFGALVPLWQFEGRLLNLRDYTWRTCQISHDALLWGSLSSVGLGLTTPLSHSAELKDKEESRNTEYAAACSKQVIQDTRHTSLLPICTFFNTVIICHGDPTSTQNEALYRCMLSILKSGGR